MANNSVLITGANRGIGLAYARHYARAGWRVFATCRDPAAAVELGAVAGDISMHPLDVADFDAVRGLAATLRDEAIDLLINNAGIYGSDGQTFGRIDYEGWARTFQVNTMAPVAVTEAFVEHLSRGAGRLVACMTSQMGSISDGGGGYYQYRSSKAALNMAARSMARDLASKRIAVVVFHPGWVSTDMGGGAAPLSPEDSVASLTRIIDGLTLADSGRFLDYDGSEIPW